MKNNIYFENVCHVGTLFLEHIFYEFEREPIIFTCVDENKDTYLCLCSEIRYEQKWVITKCNLEMLKTLINEKSDITSVFNKSKKLIVIKKNLEGEETSILTNPEQLDRLELPKDGVYLMCDKNEASDYLKKKVLESQVFQIKTEKRGNINEN